MDASRRAWDIPNMSARPDKKESAQASARAIVARLEKIRPDGLSERQWTQRAGVSPSFFSNLRGTPTKPPSDPSVDQLRQILKIANSTLAEFFLPEARGRVLARPSQLDVEKAFSDALAGMPSRSADRPRYLAQVVQDLLGLPATSTTSLDDSDQIGMDDPTEVAPLRRATKPK